MNLADFRSTFEARTGRTAAGPSARARFLRCVNLALNDVVGRLPDGLLREEWRFRLEPAVTGTCSIHASDPRVLTITTASASIRPP